MKNVTLQFAGLLWLLLAMGCGGGGDEGGGTTVPLDTSVPADTAPTETDTDLSANLVVSETFDFRIDRSLQVYLSDTPPGPGVVNIYYATGYYDEVTKTHYPDHTALVASWRPSVEQGVNVNVNRNWQGLLFEWVPETAEGREQYLYFPDSELGAELYISL